MKYKKNTYLPIFQWTLGSCLISSMVLEGSRTFIRPIYGKGDGLLAEALGILPNLLAGFGMPFLPLAIYFAFLMELESDHVEQASIDRYKMSKKQLMNCFLIFTFLITMGLVFWEYKQINRNLVFDYKDIVATLIGGFVSALFFKIKLLNSKINVA